VSDQVRPPGGREPDEGEAEPGGEADGEEAAPGPEEHRGEGEGRSHRMKRIKSIV